MEEITEYLAPFFDLLKSDSRLKIMIVLTGAGVLYDEWGITTHYGLGKTIALDEEGKRIYDRVFDGEAIDYSKLEGHYEIIETEERFNEIIQSKK
jgi:hypothetical protein